MPPGSSIISDTSIVQAFQIMQNTRLADDDERDVTYYYLGDYTSLAFS